MSDVKSETEAKTRRRDAVRLIITRRERAPRSPRMERAFKRLLWRYLEDRQATAEKGSTDVQE
jgi:hypothetical protein